MADAGDVDDLTLTWSGASKKRPVRLKKEEDGRWRLVQPDYGTVDVSALLPNLAQLKVEDRPDGQPDYVAEQVKDLTKYGLGPKAERLTIKVKAGNKE